MDKQNNGHAFIFFEYKGSKFKLYISESNICEYADYNYEKGCRGDDSCEHLDTHYTTIYDIRFDEFRAQDYIRASLTIDEGDDSLVPEVREILGRSLSEINFEQYVDAVAEIDYFTVGEHGDGDQVLKKTMPKSSDLFVLIASNLKNDEDMKNTSSTIYFRGERE